MRVLTILLLVATTSYAQSPDSARYSTDEVIKIVRKYKDNTAGTSAIISNIAERYEGESEQLELITFY